MPNLLLGWPNYVVSGALSASAAEVALPVTNLANDQGAASLAWQCPSTAGWFQVDAGASVPMRGFSIHRCNLTSSATLRVRVWAATDTSTAPVLDATVTGLVPGKGQLIVLAPATITGRTVRFDVADPANPDGHLNIAQAFVGPTWQPERNFGYASSILRNDSAATTVTRGGAEIVRPDWQQRGFDIVLGAVTPAELSILDNLDSQARLGGNMLFVPNPASPRVAAEAVFGRVRPASGIGYANNSARTRSYRATITERL